MDIISNPRGPRFRRAFNFNRKDRLTIVTWLWDRKGSGLGPKHVNILRDMIARGYGKPHRFVCITDDPSGIECETYPLWSDYSDLVNPHNASLPSCFRRLKLFSKEAIQLFGQRRVSLDLDCIVTGDLTPLFERDEPFVGWGVKGSFHDRVYQGSMWLVQGEKYASVWDNFHPQFSPKTAYAAGYGGTDQAWMSWFIGQKAAWSNLDGVYNWKTDLLPRGGTLPPSRIVFFPGDNGKPWESHTREKYPWLKEYYPW